MGIKFTCPACGHALNVKSELAGKRGRCPKCQAKIDIPAEGVTPDAPANPLENSPETAPAPAVTTLPADASPGLPGSRPSEIASIVAAEEPTKTFVSDADPIAEAPTLQWYAMPPGATNQYGPATGEEFRVWMQEGRIPADALVWRQDWPDWKRAASVFPQLAIPAPPTLPTAPVAVAAVPVTPAAQPAITPVQQAFPLPGSVPGAIPIGQASPPVADGFPTMPRDDADPVRGTTGRSRAYRPRSNTGPLIAIVVLLLAMIPLAYFVWKVVSEQIISPPPAAPNSADAKAETGDSPPADQNEAAGSNESEE